MCSDGGKKRCRYLVKPGHYASEVEQLDERDCAPHNLESSSYGGCKGRAGRAQRQTKGRTHLSNDIHLYMF